MIMAPWFLLYDVLQSRSVRIRADHHRGRLLARAPLTMSASGALCVLSIGRVVQSRRRGIAVLCEGRDLMMYAAAVC